MRKENFRWSECALRCKERKQIGSSDGYHKEKNNEPCASRTGYVPKGEEAVIGSTWS